MGLSQDTMEAQQRVSKQGPPILPLPLKVTLLELKLA